MHGYPFDAVNGDQRISVILGGHQVGEVDRTPARWQLQRDDGMSVPNMNGADKSELQDRLVQFGVQHLPQPP